MMAVCNETYTRLYVEREKQSASLETLEYVLSYHTHNMLPYSETGKHTRQSYLVTIFTQQPRTTLTLLFHLNRKTTLP
jgi:hypothetical protein